MYPQSFSFTLLVPANSYVPKLFPFAPLQVCLLLFFTPLREMGFSSLSSSPYFVFHTLVNDVFALTFLLQFLRTSFFFNLYSEILSLTSQFSFYAVSLATVYLGTVMLFCNPALVASKKLDNHCF